MVSELPPQVQLRVEHWFTPIFAFCGSIINLHQVLHRPQNKEKPMQNNFEAPVWLLKSFECSIVWCDLRMGRSIVHCQRNHPRKPKFSRNRAILPDHFSGVKFYNGLFLDKLFLVLHLLFFSTVRCSWRSSVPRGFR